MNKDIKEVALHGAELLEAEATAMRECHTTNGSDCGDDVEAKAGHDAMLATAASLRRLVAELQKGAEPVYCTPTEHEGRIVYEHTAEPIPNADYFALYTHHQPKVMVLEGWKPVPLEPTREMLEAGELESDNEKGTYESVYRAMLSAAPSLPAADDARSGWISVEERLPEVELGGEMHCFVTLRNTQTGKLRVTDAYWCNKPVDPAWGESIDAPDWALTDDDGGYVPVVGWADRTHHPDYSGYYEPMGNQYTEVVAWKPIAYPAAPAMQASGQEGGA